MTIAPKTFKLFVTQGDILKFPRGEKLILTANVRPSDAMIFQYIIQSSKT